MQNWTMDLESRIWNLEIWNLELEFFSSSKLRTPNPNSNFFSVHALFELNEFGIELPLGGLEMSSHVVMKIKVIAFFRLRYHQ